MQLCTPDDPYPVLTLNAESHSPFLLTVDHADNLIPQKLHDLGLSEKERNRHIAVDIGILEVSRRLSGLLAAPLIAQRYSRLVIDCNRRPGVASSIPEVSDGTPIPGNQNLTASDREARETEIFLPYHNQIEQFLEARRLDQTLLIAMHSFTPSMQGHNRPWHIGLLTHKDRRLAIPILKALRAMENLTIGDNDPYAVCPINDYGLMIHGHERGLAHVGFEIRQDLISHEKGQIEWADRIAAVLKAIPVDLLNA